ncbi:PBP1A family penicillin-binding protein [Halobacillus rhizosphaerae]|uniref:transglycosylase domain-containing protein n=1 Tax=Halobacillus rhizosphaerae TaxID=3064889 RepID=UPI00398AD906
MILFIRFSLKWAKRSVKLAVFTAILAALAVIGILGLAISQGPPSLMTEQNTLYYSKDGSVIGEDHGAEERYWIKKDEMPQSIIDATVSIEDHRFYDHFGFDFRRIASAGLKDIKTMSMAEGASTITQQYAKNLYLSQEKTWKRKLSEALFAVRLELFYSKDEILEGYLNTIYYGHGAYGIEAASRSYFDKHAKNLTLAEATMLAGIPKGPSYYSPLVNEENATSRQAKVLSEMEKNGYITASEEQQAQAVTLAYSDKEAEVAHSEVAPYFQDQVVQEAANLLHISREELRTGGYHIHTSLIKEHQQDLDKAIREDINPNDDVQTAAVVMDSNTGAVTALAGGRDYAASSYNRATQAKRMVGSTIKPFLYYAALGKGYSPVTMKESKPTTFELKNGKMYAPANYNDYYADKPITMAQALALSDNIYAVKTNMEIGPKNLVKTLHTFGINGKLPAVPSLALGTASISLYDMVNGYGRLISGTESIHAHTVDKITDRHGNVLYEYKPTYKEDDKIDPDNAFEVTHMMTGMFDTALNGYMSVTGSTIADRLTRMYGGKSGTTDYDSWMIGFSPQYVTGVWTGYDDGSKKLTKTADHQIPKEVWADTMEDIHKSLPNAAFTPTPGVKGVYIDPDTGKLSGPNCPKERLVYLKKKDIPKETCGGDDSKLKDEVEKEFKDNRWFKSMVDWFF